MSDKWAFTLSFANHSPASPKTKSRTVYPVLLQIIGAIAVPNKNIVANNKPIVSQVRCLECLRSLFELTYVRTIAKFSVADLLLNCSFASSLIPSISSIASLMSLSNSFIFLLLDIFSPPDYTPLVRYSFTDLPQNIMSTFLLKRQIKWARQDSNLRSIGYEPTALPLSYEPPEQ